MLHNAPSNALIFIGGPADARTLAWNEPYNSTQTRIRKGEKCNANIFRLPRS